MLNFTNTSTKQPFKAIAEWSDITLEQAMKIRQIDLSGVESRIDLFERPVLVNELWKKFTTLDDVQSVSYPERVHHAWVLWIPFIRDLQSEYPHTFHPQMIAEFEHSGIKYLLPESLTINEETILSYHADGKHYAEATNLLTLYNDLAQDGINFMPAFVASVVVEQRGEEWNEQQVADRAKAFKQLTMDKVWEVFFCISELLYKRLSDMLNFLKVNQTLKPKERQSSTISYLRSRKAALQERLKALTS
jgi:hypothetical protein